jgi:hypothetical protein
MSYFALDENTIPKLISLSLSNTPDSSEKKSEEAARDLSF